MYLVYGKITNDLYSIFKQGWRREPSEKNYSLDVFEI